MNNATPPIDADRHDTNVQHVVVHHTDATSTRPQRLFGLGVIARTGIRAKEIVRKILPRDDRRSPNAPSRQVLLLVNLLLAVTAISIAAAVYVFWFR